VSRIADPSLWHEGRDRLDWARRFMPATAALAAELRASGVVRGVRIALSDVLEPKTANVALFLAEAGGMATDWSGEPYRVGRRNGLLAAADARLWSLAADILLAPACGLVAQPMGDVSLAC